MSGLPPTASMNTRAHSTTAQPGSDWSGREDASLADGAKATEFPAPRGGPLTVKVGQPHFSPSPA